MMDQSELEHLAEELTDRLGRSGRIFLTGELGSGKSVFARAVLRHLGVEGEIPSPSFIVDAVYDAGGLEIHHIDLYRLQGSQEELDFYGIGEVLDSDSFIVMEWADRLAEDLLEDGTMVHLAFSAVPDMREVTVDGRRMAGHRD
jgi:tRNA threonylcarbamoyl adenosine modification protein YjeE